MNLPVQAQTNGVNNTTIVWASSTILTIRTFAQVTVERLGARLYRQSRTPPAERMLDSAYTNCTSFTGHGSERGSKKRQEDGSDLSDRGGGQYGWHLGSERTGGWNG